MAAAVTPGQSFNIVVPPGVAPGGTFPVQTPSGQTMAVAVPMGVSPGQTIQVQMPAANPPPPSDNLVDFIPSASFAGARPGYSFKSGPQGSGYYRDNGPMTPGTQQSSVAMNIQQPPNATPQAPPRNLCEIWKRAPWWHKMIFVLAVLGFIGLAVFIINLCSVNDDERCDDTGGWGRRLGLVRAD